MCHLASMPQFCPRQQQAQRKKRPPWSSRTDDGVATFGLRPHHFSSSLDSLYEDMTWSVSCRSVRPSVLRRVTPWSLDSKGGGGCVRDVQSARGLSPLSGLTVSRASCQRESDSTVQSVYMQTKSRDHTPDSQRANRCASILSAGHDEPAFQPGLVLQGERDDYARHARSKDLFLLAR